MVKSQKKIVDNFSVTSPQKNTCRMLFVFFFFFTLLVLLGKITALSRVNNIYK